LGGLEREAHDIGWRGGDQVETRLMRRRAEAAARSVHLTALLLATVEVNGGVSGVGVVLK